MKEPEVRFVSVLVPHPLVYDVKLTLQTTGLSEPSSVLRDVVNEIHSDLSDLLHTVRINEQDQEEGGGISSSNQQSQFLMSSQQQHSSDQTSL